MFGSFVLVISDPSTRQKDKYKPRKRSDNPLPNRGRLCLRDIIKVSCASLFNL